jgi:ABC-type nitrate/sulfonate/bicarbonate transport system permease component
MAATPFIVLVPLLFIWLGIGSPARVVLVFLVTLFPMLNSVIAARPNSAAVADTDATPAATQSASRNTIAAVLGAARLGLMLAVSAVAVAEMFASQQGVGFLLTNYASAFDTTALMATLVVVLVPTILLGMLLQGIEDQFAG